MRKIDALAKGFERDRRFVILNHKEKQAFRCFDSLSFMDSGIIVDCKLEQSKIDELINCRFIEEGWELLTGGELVDDFTPKNCPWNKPLYVELTPVEALRKLAALEDPTQGFVAEFSDDGETWEEDRIIGVTLRNISYPFSGNLTTYKKCRIRKED
jgi:hypothetical protein